MDGGRPERLVWDVPTTMDHIITAIEVRHDIEVSPDVLGEVRNIIESTVKAATEAERARCLRAAEGWSDTSAGKGIAEAIREGK